MVAIPCWESEASETKQSGFSGHTTHCIYCISLQIYVQLGTISLKISSLVRTLQADGPKFIFNINSTAFYESKVEIQEKSRTQGSYPKNV